MEKNKDIIQDVYDQNSYLVAGGYSSNEVSGYHQGVAQDVLDYHFYRKENEWAADVVMECTAAMLNTQHHLYHLDTGWDSMIPNMLSGYKFWLQRSRMKYHDGIDGDKVQKLNNGERFYIYHENRAHFRPCHIGFK